MNAVKFDPTPLRNAKLIKQLGLRELARALNTSAPVVSDILNGKRKKCRFIAPLCKYLKVKIEDCYVEVEDVKNKKTA
jgi:transcriptional regulator with XRE-family HTH domain